MSRYCPLLTGMVVCQKADCAWWYEGEEKCAVLVIAGGLINLSYIVEGLGKG